MTVVETPHPYLNDIDIDRTILHANAKELTIEFDEQVQTKNMCNFPFLLSVVTHPLQHSDTITFSSDAWKEAIQKELAKSSKKVVYTDFDVDINLTVYVAI